MKDKILDFIKSMPKRYGWKFWVCLIAAIFCFYIGWEENGIGSALAYFFVMPLVIMFIIYFYYYLFKAGKATGKAAGKGAWKATKYVGKGVAASVAAGMASNGAGGGKSESKNESKSYQKEVRRVWVGTYKGKYSAAPKQLSVPSWQTIHGPSAEEIKEAAMKLGYDKTQAFYIVGSNHDWEWK